MKLLSLIVPCYNEEESLPLFYQAFLDLTEKLKDKITLEVIFVNDGSRDKTVEIAKTLACNDARVKYISFSRNFGKEPAMLAGLAKSRGDYAVIIDADLQHPPELILEMYDKIQQEGVDCVAARRSSRDGEPIIRSLFSRLFYVLMGQISDTPVVSGACDFRLMKRQMVDAILSMGEYNRFSKGIFSFVGFQTEWISYENVERAAGETSWSFWGLFKYSLEGIFAFSTKPLHISSILGFLLCVFSLIFGSITILKTLFYGEAISGYTSIICVCSFLGGIQLFSIGILGQYIGKIYLETKNRPIYISKEEN